MESLNAATIPEAKEQERKNNPDIEAVNWAKTHEEKLRQNESVSKLVDLDTLFSSLEFLDDNLNLNTEKSRTLISEFLVQHCLMNNIDPDTLPTGVLAKLTDILLVVMGEENPLYHWNKGFLEQSTKKPPEIYSSLVSYGGFWGVTLETDNPSTTRGAAEIQKSLAQVLIEIAKNQAVYANREIPFLPDAPDPKTQERHIKDAEEYLEKVNGEPHTLGLLKYNPLIRMKDGKTYYREYDTIETMLVRVYRESKDGKKAEYIDVPANEILGKSPQELEKILLEENTKIGKNGWTELPDSYPDLSQDAPIIGISIGESPRPDSPLYIHCRSGQGMIHLHYNTDRKNMDMYFNHVSFDGVPGMDWATAVAEAIGATGKRQTPGLTVNVQPPSRFGEPLTPNGFRHLTEVIKEHDEANPYLDNPELKNLVLLLELSDVSLSDEMSPEQYKAIKEAVEAINKECYDPIVEGVTAMFAQDSAEGKGISKEAQKVILNRLLASKMTVYKFMDSIGRQYYGPEVGCMVPRNTDTRLALIEVKAFSDALAQLIRTYPNRKEEGASTVFDASAVITDTEGEEVSIDLKAETTESYTAMIRESGQTWLHNFSDLIVLLRQTAYFRKLSETTAQVLNREIFEATQLEFMTSHGGDGTKMSPDRSHAVAALAIFFSALTTDAEPRFSIAASDIKIVSNGEETLRFNYRDRLTTRTMDRLRMSNRHAMEHAIEKISVDLGKHDPDKISQIRKLANRALDGCIKASAQNTRTHPDYAESNLFTVSTLLGNEVRNQEGFEDLMEGLHYLTIAGLLDYHESFLDTCAQAARETAAAMKSK